MGALKSNYSERLGQHQREKKQELIKQIDGNRTGAINKKEMDLKLAKLMK